MLLAAARKWFAFGDYSNDGRNARTHGSSNDGDHIAGSSSVRALCGDFVDARWLRQLHCARRYCRQARKQPALLTIRPKVDTFETERFDTFKKLQVF